MAEWLMAHHSFSVQGNLRFCGILVTIRNRTPKTDYAVTTMKIDY